MTEKVQNLFSGFKPATTEEWEAAIHSDLKGKDYDRALVWKTNEGINVRPYYRSEDLDGLDYLDVLPGEFPYVRGNNKTGNDWLIRQDIYVNDFSEANKKAREILNKGVNSLGFVFDCTVEITKDDLAVLLKGICIKAAEINFVCECANCSLAEVFAEYVSESGKDAAVYGSASNDPLGSFVLKGKLEGDAFEKLEKSIEKTSGLPNFRVITVNGKYFSNSGASIVQELAFSLAQGAEYLIKLTEADISADNVAQNIKFNFGIGKNHFMEIAKLRAARLLWALIVKEFNPADNESAKMIIHSETGTYNKTVYDSYVNMLRTQTEAMSAALGGAGSITVLPFNVVYDDTNDFSERIARNQQILLKEEAHLDKIADPGAGSYYIENLTASVAEYAWNLFLDIQEKGGFSEAFKSGFVQKEISEMAAKRDNNVALRRENLLGTNQFPNFTETAGAEYPDSVFSATDLTEEGAATETLKQYRLAQPFEKLRYRTDVYSKSNKRPVVFLLTIGNLAMRKARAQFSSNFFAVAGFEVIDNNGFETVEEGIKEAKAKNAGIVVLCSSDDEYAVYAPEALGMLDKEIFVIAGNPDCRAELETKGIRNFIHVRSNILEELNMYQEMLNV